MSNRTNTKPQGKHGKVCQCSPCVRERLEAYREKVGLMSSPRPPENITQTVPVRGHFRRHPGHLRKDPGLRDLVLDVVKGLVLDGRFNG